MPLWAFIVAVAGLFIVIILLIVLAMYCCRKMRHKGANVVKVEQIELEKNSESKMNDYNT